MKKILAIVLALAMVFCLAACGEKEAAPAAETAKTKFYVLGPNPDHGWTAQAGIEALIEAGIPHIEFDRFIYDTMGDAVVNYSGDNYAVGAGIAYWLQQHGMKPGDTLLTLRGDNGSVCDYRQQGFEEYLLGTRAYSDKLQGEFKNQDVWTQEQIDAAKTYTAADCKWSADGAISYVEPKLAEIIETAKANGGNLYIYSMDDEMTFGVMTVLEGLDDATAKDFEDLNVYISAIGGMQELYDVMQSKGTQGAVADKYFDDLMSVSFNPSMMKTVIDYAVEYLDGNSSFQQGQEATEPVFIVDRTTASKFEGFQGH